MEGSVGVGKIILANDNVSTKNIRMYLKLVAGVDLLPLFVCRILCLFRRMLNLAALPWQVFIYISCLVINEDIGKDCETHKSSLLA